MNTPTEVEAILRAAIEKKIADGWSIKPDIAYDADDKRCCAIGAAKEDAKWFSPSEYAEALGITPDAVRGITEGFDGGDAYPGKWHALGAKLRREYVR